MSATKYGSERGIIAANFPSGHSKEQPDSLISRFVRKDAGSVGSINSDPTASGSRADRSSFWAAAMALCAKVLLEDAKDGAQVQIISVVRERAVLF